MNLKTIRESYTKFINTLVDAGVKLNESQKASLDSFILAIESKMSKQREAAIKATKKVVEEHLEKQYKQVFESILKHMQENAELASKVQDKITQINESKKVSRKVSNFLDVYVESVLPKKKILDYDRMQKLEQIHESLKDLLIVNEDAIETKKAELQESFNKDKKALETQIAKLQVKLNESMAKTTKLNKKIDQFKALELLESKTKDLPSYEARQMKKRLAEATTVEIEKTFDKVLESVKEEMKEAEKDDETTLEAEVKDIIEAEEDVKEDEVNEAGEAKNKAPVKIELELVDVEDVDAAKAFVEEILGKDASKVSIDPNSDFGSFGTVWKFSGPRWLCRKLWASTMMDDGSKWWKTSDLSIPEKFNGGHSDQYSNPATFREVIVKEDDMLDGRNHNLHVKEAEKKEDDVELDESDIIDAALMQRWCDQAARINTDIVRA